MTRRKPSEYDFTRGLYDELLLPTSGSKRRSTFPRRGKIKHIDIHHMTVKDTGNGGANEKCVDIWRTREASAHYGIDNNEIAQFVYDNREAWGNANSTANREGIIVEHANSTLGPKWEISDATIRSSVKLVANLHVIHKLGRPTSKGFGESGTIRTHQSFYATSCPGPYFKKIWASYIAKVQAEYDRITKKSPAKPTPKPATPPKPPAATGPTVTSTSLNAGSYNAHGAKTYKTRTDRYVKRRTTSEVDVINLQEVGNGANVKGKPNCYMRGRLDKGFGDLYRRHIGADGRYCYSNPGRVKPIKSGVIVAAKSTWYRKDDKQASYLVFEKSGVRAMDVSFHLESEPGAEADAKRVTSMLSVVDQALVIAKVHGVDRRNILFVGDTNSAGMVVRAMAKAGWRNVAAGGKYENRHTYMGWDGKARERFDYGFVHESAGPAFMNAIHESTDISDHAELVIKRTLTK